MNKNAKMWRFLRFWLDKFRVGGGGGGGKQ